MDIHQVLIQKNADKNKRFSALAQQNEEKCYLDARGNRKINNK
jgi:hypothetical protein